jgi:hypothetical protein
MLQLKELLQAPLGKLQMGFMLSFFEVDLVGKLERFGAFSPLKIQEKLQRQSAKKPPIPCKKSHSFYPIVRRQNNGHIKDKP